MIWYMEDRDFSREKIPIFKLCQEYGICERAFGKKNAGKNKINAVVVV